MILESTHWNTYGRGVSPPSYPMTFAPVYKDYMWGGDAIPTLYHRDATVHPCAESWEITDRPDGMSVVKNGPLSGTTLRQLMDDMGRDLTGTASANGPGTAFPLLIKIIDAKQRLSLQVHPDDQDAIRMGSEAKSEAWYVLNAQPGSRIYAGLAPGTSQSDFEQALRTERLEDVLNSIPAIPGHAIFIPGGCTHAIGEGCLLLEIQQNSNTTYRVYDWGRVGTDGLPRQLHMEQALEVIKWNTPLPVLVSPEPDASPGSEPAGPLHVLSCPYFTISSMKLSSSEHHSNDGQSFHAFFTITGTADFDGYGHSISAPAGTSVLIPAAVAEYSITPKSKNTEILRISLP
jgi:mannose-6-phosphate isomerase